RDLNQRHFEIWSRLEGEALHRNFANDAEMSMLVLHPEYWRKGRGSEMVRWGQNLADMDNVRQGVSAAAMGEELYLHLGYELIERISVPGDSDDPEGIRMGIRVYTPRP
ncbi:hypothetical protein QQS21_012258, partial [Conoideocrella luteorostrata]